MNSDGRKSTFLKIKIACSSYLNVDALLDITINIFLFIIQIYTVVLIKKNNNTKKLFKFKLLKSMLFLQQTDIVYGLHEQN